LRASFFTFPLVVLFSLLSACAGSIGPKRDINDRTNSLVFAYIDMRDAPTEVDNASLKPQGEEGYWHMSVEDGLMYQQYLPPGSYQLATLSGSGLFKGSYRYSFPIYGRNQSAIRIQRPGIYYLGSFRYKGIKTGMFDADGKFDIERVDSPTEVELLQRILNQEWVTGSQYEERIRNRLAELKSER
jgi:hypothetical protein